MLPTHQGPQPAALSRLVIVVHLVLALAAGVALTIVPALSTRARGHEQRAAWSMIGHDINDTRSQPLESHIGPRNAARLLPKWVFTTGGDVSATPAVGDERGHAGRDIDRDDNDNDDDGEDEDDDGDRDDRGHGDRAVYFPDWGGNLWKVDAETGQVVWWRAISDYNGIPGSISRTSPVLAHGMVYVADLNGNMMAVDAATGNLRWITELDPHPAAIVTTSPIFHRDRLYISISSNETAYARQTPGYVCCTFRGSMIALDARTGRIVWQTFVLPDNGGQAGSYAGGAFVNPPAIDLKEGLVYGAAGQLYTQPASVTACLASTPNGWSEACYDEGAYFNSVIAFDLRTGEPRWSFRGAGLDAWQLACGSQPPSVTWCAAPATATAPRQFSVWDYAGAGANVFKARINGRTRDVVGIGQKTGIYWALDAATGEYLWSKLVGPGSDPGGIQWGTAYDGRRIYAAIGHNTRQEYRLPSGDVIKGGSWAALDPSSGAILWQIADPQDVPDLAALTVANGVLYAGSMGRTSDPRGDQMYALDTATGAILWRFAAGGSVVSGPAVVRGTVYWGSGYARTGGVGNNKFYAFSIDGK